MLVPPAAPRELAGGIQKFSNQNRAPLGILDEDARGLVAPDGYDILRQPLLRIFQPSFNNLVVQHYQRCFITSHQGLNPSTTYLLSSTRCRSWGKNPISSNGASATTRPFGHGGGNRHQRWRFMRSRISTTDVFLGRADPRTPHNGVVIDTSGVTDPAARKASTRTEHWGASGLGPSLTSIRERLIPYVCTRGEHLSLAT